MHTQSDTADQRADRFQIDVETATAVAAALGAYGRALGHVRNLEQMVGELEQLPRCNGREFWQGGRPHDDGTLYANHSTGGTCPLHGRHADDHKPLRKYIGRKHANIAATLEAMANEQECQRARTALEQAQRAASAARSVLVGQ